MRLRKLEMKDAPHMLEWMHDESVVFHMGTNFAEKKLEDCENFIEYSKSNTNDVHYAIVNELDEYMGTVSLKHVDNQLKMAEFAITVRKCAMGKGYSQYGMKEIIRIAKEEFGLLEVIWCVSKYNERAVRFYDKSGYRRITEVPETYLNLYEEDVRENFYWYTSD